ncbi:MAG: tRNA (adenosine(37)-N6)-dimethylallyltransferase MiaA [Fimbriiglobus sp.]|jgi:tRNA dimethylallyltransferase|nr:tRNA (adenosine(37)-N6)-dimethylallyltransferase MiaA [Fimbriiglobus sp.]
MMPTPADFADAAILTGPTGSGKSAVALELAERLNAEIVCMDSMTLYRGMDIGTAKPTAAEQARVPHHLLDVLDPWESGSVAWWLERAAEACRQIRGRGRRPLFVGGTPFYLKAVRCGLFDAVAVDPAIRPRLEAEAEQLGPEALHRRLAAVDPKAAARLHPNDVRRVVRALEVFEGTGRPISDHQQTWESPPEVGLRIPCAYLDWPRDELYRRIDARVGAMLDAGWAEEADRLRLLPRPLSKEASAALGYRELLSRPAGSAVSEAMADGIRLRTRQFAKRQLTWFRNLAQCSAIDPRQADLLLELERILASRPN